MTLKEMPIAAKKSAVIISQDGEIEQHIPHEEENLLGSKLEESTETEVPPTINQVVYVNNIEQDEVALEELVSKPKIDLKLVMVPVVMLALMLSMYMLFSPADDYNSGSDTEKPVINAVSANVEPISKIENHPHSISELKKIANLVLEDEEQIIANIDLFVDNWNLMDKFSQQDLNNSFWMERFKPLLDQKIETFKSSDDKFSPEHSINYRNSLVNMAAVVNSLDIDIKTTNNEAELDGEFEEIFKEISSELAIAELDKKLSDAQRSTPVETEATQITATPEKINKSTNGFSESDVNYLLGQYATTYEFGSTSKIMKLFSARSGYKKALKKNFKKVFSYSSDRSIRFSNFEWQFLENSIVGNGKYKAKITLKQDKGTRHVSAKIRVKFRAVKDSLRIARMNFSKVKVRLDKPKSASRIPVNFPVAKASKNPKHQIKAKNSSEKFIGTTKTKTVKNKTRIKIPTAAELQDIVTRFIGAYESGNVSALDRIFANNAKTNDQNGLPEIKKDYRILFNTTSDRQLFIQDLKWTIIDNNARGKGTLNLLIVADGSISINSQQGEIQITAQKNNEKLRITHLFHDLRN